ncbi:MAG: 50S ribosomal protein L4 [Deltaproteobacteria bacterium]|nr:50S ribosomal protein L4 [Deltaproteobacteria bacterium]
MTVIDIYNIQAEKISQMEINEGLFEESVRNDVLHQVVVSQLANKRSGNASSKTRAEVNASGKKLYKQKGTGNARVGNEGAQHRVGGGVAFGPRPREYSVKVSKKIKKAALRMALTDKLHSNHLIVIDDFNLPEIKTSKFVEVMNRFKVSKALIVTDGKNETLEKSSKNIPWVKVIRHEGLNAYDILNHDHLFLVKSTIKKIEEALIS